MSGTCKVGFTLIELLVVLFIIGLIATIAIPNLRQQQPNYERTQMVENLRALLSLAWQEALSRQKTQRIFFDFKKRTMRLEQEQEGVDAQGNPIFKPSQLNFAITEYQWGQHLEIKQFFIEGTNEMQAGRKQLTVFFYIVPNGYAQAVIINMLDSSQKEKQGKESPIGLVINPFSVRLKDYDTFQQP